MSLWDERFNNHEIWRAAERARDAMNQTRQPDDPAERDALDYAGTVLELIERRRRGTDAREVSPAMLSNAQSVVENFASHILSAVNGQYLWTQVVPAVDEVVTAFAAWPPLRGVELVDALASAVERFQERAVGAADEVVKRVSSIEQRLITIDARQEKVEDAVAAEQQKISEAVAAFRVSGSEAVRQWTDEREGMINERAAAWDAALAEASEQAEAHRHLMSEHEIRSRKVLEAIGVNATATDFGMYAGEQRDSANRWRTIAWLVFLLASVWFVASSLPWLTDGADIWESSLARLGVSAAVAGVGAYAARESSQHRRQERQAKQVQLVLTALEPFIANLPIDDQNAIRAEAARAIFVLRGEDGDGASISEGPYAELMKVVLAKIPDRS